MERPVSNGRKAAMSYETKRRTRRDKQRNQQSLFQSITTFPTSAWGFYNMGIHICDEIGKEFNIPPSQLWGLVSQHCGRAPKALANSARRISQILETEHTFDRSTQTKEETIQKKVIEAVLDSYIDEEGKLIKNPTFIEYLTDVHSACTDVNIAPLSKTTLWKYTKLFHWSFKTPNKQTNLNKQDTMVKRVEFSKQLINILDDPMVEPLFMDEMSFFVSKNRAKRLAPKDHDKVFFELPAPSRHPSLSITTYMTPNHLLSMHFKKETTTAEHFGDELLAALCVADEKIDPSKEIKIILDNERWHTDTLLKKTIKTVKEKRREREKLQKVGHVNRIMTWRGWIKKQSQIPLKQFLVSNPQTTLTASTLWNS